ncbi:ketosteroid isomerase-like protein [Kineococcus xinjiangensis]|uniref:Ketosteroid isomerase-like protein n=1 Tax=Kineococcus xinjiangensis TaxID=512762 RepID=A0A2S6IVL1_9ACTN|nr:nuclear transport factor 2 family protein [Kineococcus xinjiangensis]PPK98193.1 ketosteroid isomerase-like protein [Kineococcus xinjiangensis]
MAAPADLVRRFYETRRGGDVDALREFLAPDVRWREPDVGEHMGLLLGADAVLDMVRRARATTGGTFTLEVVEAVQTRCTCAAVVAWSAEKGGRRIDGRELAVFDVADGRITAAAFHPERLADDEAFWA